MGIPARRRLRKGADINRVRDQGKRAICDAFVLFVLPRTDGLTAPESPASAKVAVVASRRVGNAVCRSRAKRLLREVFRLHPELIPAGAEVVLIARNPIVKMTYPAVAQRYHHQCAYLKRKWWPDEATLGADKEIAPDGSA